MAVLVGPSGVQTSQGGRGLAKQQLCTCITLFCTFLCRSCTTTTWNDQILSFFEDENGKPINSTISVWTWARSPLFISNLNSPFLSNWATWDNREKMWKDAKRISQGRFHGRRRCRIVRSLLVNLRNRTRDDRRRQSLCDKRDKTFVGNNFSPNLIFL